MGFGERLLKFLKFVGLLCITFGLYGLWWSIAMAEERNKLLKEIRDDLQKMQNADPSLADQSEDASMSAGESDN